MTTETYVINDDWKILPLSWSLNNPNCWCDEFEYRQQKVEEMTKVILHTELPRVLITIVVQYLRRHWMNFEVGDLLAVRDCVDDWGAGVITEVGLRQIQVHYFGWHDTWNEYFPVETVCTRIRPLRGPPMIYGLINRKSFYEKMISN